MEEIEKIDYIASIILLLIFCIVLTIVYRIPSIKYDLNNDGEVDLKDMVILRNYILEN